MKNPESFRRISRSCFALVCTGSVGVACATTPDQPFPAAHIRAHLEFLADDLLEGREAGTRGYDIAANYVATHFKLIGLQPAGTHGYFQPVPLRRSVLRPGTVSLQVRTSRGTQTFSDSDHVAARPSMTEAEQRVEADCVFAGYGIVAPELRRDDYAKLDVRETARDISPAAIRLVGC